jgi:chemotaxis response regulator CheB
MCQMEQAGQCKAVTVLVVDDSRWFREAAANVVRATPGFELIGEASSGEAAVRLADWLAPDITLMDVRMPGLDGIAAARAITAAHPTATIVLLTAGRPVDLEEQPPDTVTATLDKRELRPGALEALWSMAQAERADGAAV